MIREQKYNLNLNKKTFLSLNETSENVKVKFI